MWNALQDVGYRDIELEGFRQVEKQATQESGFKCVSDGLERRGEKWWYYDLEAKRREGGYDI